MAEENEEIVKQNTEIPAEFPDETEDDTEVVEFEFNEDGTKDYNNSGIKIITEQSIKNASNLFENSYTNLKGERVVEQSIYEPKLELPLSKEQSLPTQEVKAEQPIVSENPALRDVESTEKALNDVQKIENPNNKQVEIFKKIKF